MSPRTRLACALLPSALASLAIALAPGGLRGAADPQQGGAPDYNRDVRPILSKHCFGCHGPDAESREAKLRLDTAEGATADRGGYAAVVPGDPAASELIYRVTTDERDDHMPPAKTGKTLSEAEIGILTRWVESGAAYAQHWAFVPPERPAVPTFASADSDANADSDAGAGGPARLRTPIDAFVLARLEAEGLDFAPDADRRTLLRRAALDLTGLPPDAALLDSFLADHAPGAWQRAVDALLASPRYGERMASIWLDLARYADTNGYHIDNERYMWPWRDRLIASFNENQPYDRFSVEALAGDLLPDATREQLVASGFHRNHMINFEGGAIAAEYLNEYVVDRVNTTAKVWMGLTMGCAQCHDHKYDPLPQEDYYRFYAYFNTIDEKGLDGQQGNADPVVRVPTAEQEEMLGGLDARIAAGEAELATPSAEALAALAAWTAEQIATLEAEWTDGALREAQSDHPETGWEWQDGILTATGAGAAAEDYVLEFAGGEQPWRMLRIELLPGEDGAEFPRSGRAENGNWVLSELELEEVRGDVVRRIPLSVALADHAQPDYPVRYAIDGALDTGWAADAHNRREARLLQVLAAEPFGAGAEALRIHLRFRYGSAHSFARMRVAFSGAERVVAAAEPPAYGPWSLAIPKEGELVPWVEHPEFVDGKVHALAGEKTTFHLMRQVVAPAATVRTWSLGSDDAIRLSVNGEKLLDNPVARAAAPDQEQVRAPLRVGLNHVLLEIDNYGGPGGFYFRELEGSPELPGPVLAALLDAGAAAARVAQVRDFFLERHWEPWAERKRALDALREERTALLAQVPTTMVMREMKMPRATYLLHRGDYDQPRQQLTPGVPVALAASYHPSSPTPTPSAEGGTSRDDRLDLAEWLVDPRHPLTARVQVNRLWAMLFGHGLVRTQEDFGAQGEWPTHPELLDWLAVEYMESGWDTKALLKLMVSSTVYRQDSAGTAESYGRDPDNRLLARGPRFRLSAEAIRDQALAASGLLVEKLGGPSVKPYQPDGLWREVAYGGGNAGRTASVFMQDSGEALYRRSLYTFRKRSSPPPQLATFDAPNREICMVQRSRTNTPLQALVLLNDPTYLEAARVMAASVLRDEPGTRARVDRLYERVLCRPASDAEAAILLELVAERYAAFAAQPEQAELLLSVGEAPRAEGLIPAEHAAWACAAILVLNLDETVTRG